MSTAAKLGVGALVGAVLVGLAIWWLAVSDEDEGDRATADAVGPGTKRSDPPTAPTPLPSSVSDVDGTWTVTGRQPDAVTDGSFVGYRIDAVVSGVTTTVTGHTSEITGDVTLVDGVLTDGAFVVDMGALQSGDGERDREMRDRGYQYGPFPVASFRVTQPAVIDVDAALGGAPQVVPVTGELTLHGVTREITLELSASIVGTTLTVTGSADIVLADHDIDEPTGFPVTDVDDVGTLELQLFLRKDAAQP